MYQLFQFTHIVHFNTPPMADSKMMEDSKLVAEYDGVNWQPVQEGWTKHSRLTHSVFFDTEAKCQVYCDELNKHMRDGEKFLPLPECLELKYHTSFNSLIPVWSKAVREMWEIPEITGNRLHFMRQFHLWVDNEDIQSAFNTTVNAIKFIKSKR